MRFQTLPFRAFLLLLAALVLHFPEARANVELRLPEGALIGGVALGATTRGYEQLTLFEAIDEVRQAGAQVMEIQAGQAMSPTDRGAGVNDTMSDDQIATLRRKVSSSSAKLVAARVRFNNNQSANQRLFEWADKLGIEVLVGDPPEEQFDHLEKMVRKFNITVGILTGPKGGLTRTAWTDPRAIMTAVRGRDPRFGVVVNVLNLVRAGVDPYQALSDLRTRLLGVQICDFSPASAQARAVPFGTGDFDFRRLLATLDALRFDGYVAFDWPANAPEFRGDLAKAIAFVQREMTEIRRINLLRFASRDASAPSGLAYEVLTQGDMPEPVGLQPGPEDSVWIGGRRGEIWSWSAASRTNVPIARLTVDANGQRGLYGFQFDPGFRTNGHLYVYRAPMLAVGYSNRVSRFTAVTNGTSWRIGAETERILLDIPSSAHGLMQGGGLLLNPRDGCLYIGTGDNNLPEETPRFFDDPRSAAQNLADLRGKILRIQTDGRVPPDNPFVSTNGVRPEIYAFGFRNPFTLTVDPSTANVYVGDVGFDRRQDWEEIDLLKAGGNYGWPRCDGRNRDTLAATPCPLPEVIGPWFAYPHDSASAVLVGPFVGNKAPAGWPSRFSHGMFFADFPRRSIKFAQVDPVRNVVTNTLQVTIGLSGGPVSMMLTPKGDLLFVEYAGWLAGNPRDRLARIGIPPPAKPLLFHSAPALGPPGSVIPSTLRSTTNRPVPSSGARTNPPAPRAVK